MTIKQELEQAYLRREYMFIGSERAEEIKGMIQTIQDLTKKYNGCFFVGDSFYKTLGGEPFQIDSARTIVPRVGFCKDNGSVLLMYDVFQNDPPDMFDIQNKLEPNKVPVYQRVYTVTEDRIDIHKQRPALPSDTPIDEFLEDFKSVIGMVTQQKKDSGFQPKGRSKRI